MGYDDSAKENTLDYLSPKPRASRIMRSASLLNTVTWTLLAPSILLTISSITIDPVNRQHWLTGKEFNQFCYAFIVCDFLGIFFGGVAGFWGRPMALAAIPFHFLALLFIPSFMYG